MHKPSPQQLHTRESPWDYSYKT